MTLTAKELINMLKLLPEDTAITVSIPDRPVTEFEICSAIDAVYDEQAGEYTIYVK